VKIEFDPAKNLANIDKHGLDFNGIYELDWNSALVWEDVRRDYGEARYIALAMGDRLYSLSFTVRGGATRIISFRKANKREVRKYETR